MATTLLTTLEYDAIGDTNEWTYAHNPSQRGGAAPVQGDAHSCGYFMLLYFIYHIQERNLTYAQRNINDFKKQFFSLFANNLPPSIVLPLPAHDTPRAPHVNSLTHQSLHYIIAPITSRHETIHNFSTVDTADIERWELSCRRLSQHQTTPSPTTTHVISDKYPRKHLVCIPGRS